MLFNSNKVSHTVTENDLSRFILNINLDGWYVEN